MADMSVLDYAMMVGNSHVDTRVFEYRFRGPDTAINGRGEGPLIATALTDVLADGLSMVYSFFDPDYADRSLGTFMILDHIARARSMGLPYVYLGYWVEGSRKMDYKRRFRPQEHLGPRGWTAGRLNPCRHDRAVESGTSAPHALRDTESNRVASADTASLIMSNLRV